MEKNLNFHEVFKLQPGDVVSVTGGGGKSSLISKMAWELSHENRILITTTTKIYIPRDEEFEELILSECSESRKGKSKNIHYLGSEIDRDTNKILGVDDKILEKFIGKYDYIFIESDGSRGKSMKFWNEDEPIISKFSNRIIGVLNLNVLGQTFEDSVHRFHKYCQFYYIQQNERIGYSHVADYMKNGKFFRGTGDRQYFINGIEEFEKFNIGLKICNIMAETGVPIVMGSIEMDECYEYRKICAIGMLSGFSKRMGKDKLFLEYRGKNFFQLTVDRIDSIDFYERKIVTTEEKLKKLNNTADSRDYVLNVHPERGQSESLKLGIKSLGDSQGIMFFMGDQPLLTQETALKLIKHFFKTDKITVPYVEETGYSPVIFPSRYISKLLALQGEAGGKTVINSQNEVERVYFLGKDEFLDVDTQEEFSILMEKE